MKKDIEFPKVCDIAIAIAPEQDCWIAYLLNYKDIDIDSVIIASKGYGMQSGQQVKTSVLRQFWEKIVARSFVEIEMIRDHLLGLNNEFWLSFYVKNKIYDRKYVFLAESISKKNLVKIPLLDKDGVMIN